jgi:hypothetical protein
LSDFGIKSISLYSTITNSTDAQGNTQLRSASFEWDDGTAGQSAEYEFQTDNSYAVPIYWYDVPEDIVALPSPTSTDVEADLVI